MLGCDLFGRCHDCGNPVSTGGCVNPGCKSNATRAYAWTVPADGVPRPWVDHRALLREAADALDASTDHDGTESPTCSRCDSNRDLIRRLREAAK